MKRSSIALATLLALAPIAAQSKDAGRQWYLIGHNAVNTCQKASAVGSYTSPEQMHNSLRAHGIVDDIKVIRDDDDNSVRAVIVSFNREGEEIGTIWYATAEVCGEIRTKMIAKGLLADSNDLK